MIRKNLIISITLFLTMLCVATSCNKEPNPFVEHEQDITIVYGLINPHDSIHYIRVQKAYLTTGDAYVMASEAESNLYLDSLSVKIYVTNSSSNTPLMSWGPLQKCYVEKDTAGDFTWSEDLPVFYFEHIFDMNYINDKKLNLEITNTVTGKKIYGSTYMVNDIQVKQPSSLNVYNNPTFGFAPINNPNIFIEIVPTYNGKRYEAFTDFIYYEYPKGSTTEYTIHKLRWNFGSVAYNGDPLHLPSIVQNLKIYYNPYTFFTWLETQIPVNRNVIRVAKYFDFYCWSCSPDMHTYMEVNSTNTGIIQDRPEFTNLTSSTGENDVYGLFTSRINKTYLNVRAYDDTKVFLRDSTDLSFVVQYP